MQVGNVTIDNALYVSVGPALVLLAAYWLRPWLTTICKALAVSVLVIWLVSTTYLANECHSICYDGPVWHWQVLGVDSWDTLNTIESCVSQHVYETAGIGSPSIWWNMPLLGIFLWWLGTLLNKHQLHLNNSFEGYR